MATPGPSTLGRVAPGRALSALGFIVTNLKRPVERVSKFYNGRGTAEQYIKEGKLALPEAVAQWSLTTLREKLVKIGARIVRHGRYVVFQLAEVAVPRSLFAEILRRIAELRPRPPPLPV